MNLVAKEFCACQVDGGGVLVLSEFAGAAAQLQERGAAGQSARHRGDGRRAQGRLRDERGGAPAPHGGMREIVREQDIFWWVDYYLQAALGTVPDDFRDAQGVLPPDRDRRVLCRRSCAPPPWTAGTRSRPACAAAGPPSSSTTTAPSPPSRRARSSPPCRRRPGRCCGACAGALPVVIVSGRGREDVAALVGLDRPRLRGQPRLRHRRPAVSRGAEPLRLEVGEGDSREDRARRRAGPAGARGRRGGVRGAQALRRLRPLPPGGRAGAAAHRAGGGRGRGRRTRPAQGARQEALRAPPRPRLGQGPRPPLAPRRPRPRPPR